MATRKTVIAKKAVVKKRAVAKKPAAENLPVLPANGIRVPKPAKASYNPKRALDRNLLLANQVAHFHEIEKELPKRQRSGIDLKKIKTEGQAAAFIRHVTLQLHRPQKGKA